VVPFRFVVVLDKDYISAVNMRSLFSSMDTPHVESDDFASLVTVTLALLFGDRVPQQLATLPQFLRHLSANSISMVGVLLGQGMKLDESSLRLSFRLVFALWTLGTVCNFEWVLWRAHDAHDEARDPALSPIWSRDRGQFDVSVLIVDSMDRRNNSISPAGGLGGSQAAQFAAAFSTRRTTRTYLVKVRTKQIGGDLLVIAVQRPDPEPATTRAQNPIPREPARRASPPLPIPPAN